MSIEATIQEQIQSHAVVLYMKGNAQFPMCGFSGRVVEILKSCPSDFYAVNVLENEEIRQGIKTFSNWPTIPQLYVNGEFIGGCDIVVDLFNRGELQQMLNAK